MSNPLMAASQGLLRAIRRERAKRNRTPPPLRFGEDSTPPRIFYLSPDPPGPRGGVRVLYRHVDLLNDAGFDAMIIHRNRGYRAGWFRNQTRIVAASDAIITPRDTIVVPEFYGAAIPAWPFGPKVILFNQGAYYTFDGMSANDARGIMRDRVAAILTVSEDSLKLLRFAFESVPVHYARSVIDASMFQPPAEPGSRRRIAYATSRRHQERHQLLSILALRGRIDWDFVPIRDMSEAQVADTLRSSAVFLAFNEREGFGLPPAEAMACGCYVIGYHGQGSSEYFDPAYSSPIAESDLLAYASEIERVTAEYDADPDPHTQRGLAASRAVLERYNLDGLRADLSTFFTEFAKSRS